jgi:hypothetical protein
MSSVIRDQERRRAQRVMIRIPIQLQGMGHNGAAIDERGEAVVVSRCGALLQTASPLPSGAIFEVRNQFSRDVERFRVVWASGRQAGGQYDAGVELLTAREGFWGVKFPPNS